MFSLSAATRFPFTAASPSGAGVCPVQVVGPDQVVTADAIEINEYHGFVQKCVTTDKYTKTCMRAIVIPPRVVIRRIKLFPASARYNTWLTGSNVNPPNPLLVSALEN